MKKILSLCLFTLSCLWLLVACAKEPPQKEPDPNAGKHQLSPDEVRGWDDYPALLLIATRHHVGVDTVAQLVKAFSNEFSRGGIRFTLPNSHIGRLPLSHSVYEEDTPSLRKDVKFFKMQASRYGLEPSDVATIISGFYILAATSEDNSD